MIKVGDKIRDIEDNDCYFEGVVVSMDGDNVSSYKLERVVWNGELETKGDNDEIGTVIKPRWWQIEKAPMIDIFEVQRFIDSNPEGSDLDTIVMNIETHKELRHYFTNGKYKGYYMLALSILGKDEMKMGKKPKALETE